MKSINFIHSIPVKTRSSVYRWIAFSAGSLLVTCMLLLMLSMHTHWQYQTLCKTCQKLQESKTQMLSFLQDKRSLKEQEALLKQQTNKMAKSHEKQKMITRVAELITQPHEPSVALHNFEIKKKKMTLSVQSKTSDDIIAYVAYLEQSNLFAHVILQELTTKEDHVMANIHGTIT